MNIRHASAKYIFLIVALHLFLSVPSISFAAGLTIITHGFQLNGPLNDNVPDWVRSMATEVSYRLGRSDPIYRLEFMKPLAGLPPELSSVSLQEGGSSINIGATGGAVIILDWVDASDETVNYPTDLVADKFFEYLFESTNLAEVPIHLIGHSRGASINSRIAFRLAEKGIVAEQITTLDPHPVTGTTADDWPVDTYVNVLFADNYYQLGDGVHDFEGRSISGTSEINFNNMFNENETLPCSEHTLVHAFYFGTINHYALSDRDTTEDHNDTYDGCDILDSWYLYYPRSVVGFNYSLSGIIDNKKKEGISKHFHSKTGQSIGKGTRVYKPTIFNAVYPNAGFYVTGNVTANVDEGYIATGPIVDRIKVGETMEVPYYYVLFPWSSYLAQTVELFLDNNRNPYDIPQSPSILSAVHDEYYYNYHVLGNRIDAPDDIAFVQTSFDWSPTTNDIGPKYIGLKSTMGSLARYDYVPFQVTVLPADAVVPSITSVSPRTLNGLPLPQTQRIMITGSDFTPETRLILDDGVNAPYEDRVPTYDSQTQLKYDVAVGPDAATWTVQAVNGAAKDRRKNNFPRLPVGGMQSISPLWKDLVWAKVEFLHLSI